MVIAPPISQPIEQTPEEVEEEVAEETEKISIEIQQRIAAKKAKLWFTQRAHEIVADMISGGTMLEDLRDTFGVEPDWPVLADAATESVRPAFETILNSARSVVARLQFFW